MAGASARAAAPPLNSRPPAEPSARAVLNALPEAVLVIAADGRIAEANQAAEELFAVSAQQLTEMSLDQVVSPDNPLFALIAQARNDRSSVAEYAVTLRGPRLGARFVSIHIASLAEDTADLVVSIFQQSIARKLDDQLIHRNAARSVSALSSMLAHEVKNPLSGIRGAAQLLEQNAGNQDQHLTRLICEETDRVCALVDRMDMFADNRPIERMPVNIHRVLEHVRTLAESGFAQGIEINERYDPSLPPVHGNRDHLIQLVLNLVKNAAEAAPQVGGEITLSTAYRHGVRLAVPGSDERVHLPLVVSVQDNGEGIPEELRAHLFDAFVTTKADGSGLGLALVAKIVSDHGGVIEVESEPRRTAFNVFLPVAPTDARDETEST